jgi:rfaE bifunctional protein kinase chain/domain
MNAMQTLSDFAANFQHMTVLVVGDVMIDRYLRGTVNRISPEAPVPVLEYLQSEDRPGGAANVALNIRALGATPILCSIIGADQDGRAFLELLPQSGISDKGIVQSNVRQTTVKTRVMAGSQHLLRVDREDRHPLSAEEEQEFLTRTTGLINRVRPDAILFQDYNKGVLTPRVIETLIAEARKAGIPTAADPKKENFLRYRHITLFKPNLKEIRESLSASIVPEIHSLLDACNQLRAHLKHDISLVTLSEKGLFVETRDEHELIQALPRTITDVCGAGDTVISVATLALAAGMPIRDIAEVANMAGGQVCEKAGVVSIDLPQLLKEYDAWLSQ